MSPTDPTPNGNGRPLVLVAVGTDIHPFDRLMAWLEAWYAPRRELPSLLVQYGHSRAPALPGAVPFLGHDELHRAMTRTAVVVSHGGPATIIEARRVGRLPLVVPRDPGRGEHVDNHQQLFVRRLADHGLVRLCDSQPALASALDAGLSDPAALRLESDPSAQAARAEAVARVGRIVEKLVRSRRSWRAE